MIWALTTLQQALLFLGCIALVGTTGWSVVVAPGARRDLAGPGEALEESGRIVRRIARGASGVLVIAWGLRFLVQIMAFRDPFVPLREDVSFLLFDLFWGTVWIAQGVVVLLVAAIAAVGTPVSGAGRTGMAVLSVALATTLAMSGHAMGAESFRNVAVASDALHTLAAGLWIGTLGVVLAATRGTEPSVFAAQLRRFSPLAMAAGATLVAMGGVLSWTHLHAVSDLWSTGYGRILSAKVLVAIVILGLGFLNWRYGLPVSDTAEGAARVRRQAGWEAGAAVAVVLLTAVLVHASKP